MPAPSDKRWSPPGWPWELELLALIFVITAIVVPYYLQTDVHQNTQDLTLVQQADLARRLESPGSWQEQVDFMWAVGIVCVYLAHIVIAWSSITFVSTPISHLLAPLVFSGITYYRLLQISGKPGVDNPIVHGTAPEIGMWFLGVAVITILVARIRMARHMLNFKDISWEVSTPALVDKTYGELMLQIHPLIYPPRMYRACDQGLLIEGWLYVMPVPFHVVQSLDMVTRAAFLSNGTYLATSTHALIRIQLSESPEPLFISPRERESFLRYCKQHVIALKPETKSVALVDVD